MKKMIPVLAAAAMALTIAAGTAVSAAIITDVSVDNAVRTALDQAGVDESEAVFTKEAWEYDNGAEKYEVSFFIPGQTKFDCDIDVVTGEIIKCEKEAWEADDELEYAGLTPGQDARSEEEALDQAAKKAFADAGVKEEEVVVYKRGTDFEDGKAVFSVHFFLPGQTKFEYNIDMASGDIVSREQEAWEEDDNKDFFNLVHPGEEYIADGTEESGELTEAGAAAIALGDAGLSENDVTVTECRKDTDDGTVKFEVSFRTADGLEYEYEINAASGSILNKEMENDD